MPPLLKLYCNLPPNPQMKTMPAHHNPAVSPGVHHRLNKTSKSSASFLPSMYPNPVKRWDSMGNPPLQLDRDKKRQFCVLPKTGLWYLSHVSVLVIRKGTGEWSRLKQFFYIFYFLNSPTNWEAFLLGANKMVVTLCTFIWARKNQHKGFSVFSINQGLTQLYSRSYWNLFSAFKFIKDESI